MANAQGLLMDSRVAHVRELKTRIERLTAENAALRDELTSFKAHFDMAVLAAMDLQGDEPLEIWDGWNLVLGAERVAKSRNELYEQAKASGKRVWIVLDGHDENVRTLGDKVRISYTGGTGEHRADKFICDFVRMAKYLGLADKVSVRTNDKDFLSQVRHIVTR